MKDSITPIGWYKWYPRDFQMSSTVRRMSYLAQGIYRALLDLQWEDGSVPTSMDEVAQILRLNQLEQSEFEPYLETCFPNGANPKLATEREKSVAYVTKQAEHGAKGGKTGGKGRPVVIVAPEPETKPKAKSKATPKEVFTPPTLTEVEDYLYFRSWAKPMSGAKRFVSYYDDKGWRVAGKPMKDWKRAVLTWEKNMTELDFVKAPKELIYRNQSNVFLDEVVVEQVGEIEGVHYQVLPDGTKVAM
jgi:hypothetical protein